MIVFHLFSTLVVDIMQHIWMKKRALTSWKDYPLKCFHCLIGAGSNDATRPFDFILTAVICREDILAADYLMWDYEPDSITEILSHLTVENAMIGVISSNFQSPSDDDDDEDDDEEFDTDEGDDDDVDDDEDDDEDDSEGEYDDSEESSSGDGKKSHVKRFISADELLSMYSGPPQWAHLVLPPSTENGSMMFTCPVIDTSKSKGKGSTKKQNCDKKACVRCYLTKNKSSNVQQEQQMEQHFGTKYWLDAFPRDLHKYWVTVSQELECDERHRLPDPNPFIPTSLSLIPQLEQVMAHQQQMQIGDHSGSENGGQGHHLVNCVVSSDGITIYHRFANTSGFYVVSLDHLHAFCQSEHQILVAQAGYYHQIIVSTDVSERAARNAS
jgi:hypothetical protein